MKQTKIFSDLSVIFQNIWHLVHLSFYLINHIMYWCSNSIYSKIPYFDNTTVKFCFWELYSGKTMIFCLWNNNIFRFFGSLCFDHNLGSLSESQPKMGSFGEMTITFGRIAAACSNWAQTKFPKPDYNSNNMADPWKMNSWGVIRNISCPSVKKHPVYIRSFHSF